jgi:hypothetical protein
MKRKLMYLTVVCLLVVSISTAEAMPTYNILDPPGRQGIGGPFQIIGNGQNFLTFCVEYGEHINFSTTYYGSIDPVVIYGSGTAGQSDLLDQRTVGLYNYFLDKQGTLTNDQKTDIQIAIWAFQGEIGAPTNNAYYNNPGAYIGTDRTIMVLNLWTQDKQEFQYRAQSQLIAVPEPGVLLFLGAGFVAAGIMVFRRKKEELTTINS